jgi:hypothetical protein
VSNSGEVINKINIRYYFFSISYDKKINLFILVPDEITDEISALEHFSHVFQTRYGSTGLILSNDSLDQAIQKSLYSSIHDVNINIYSIFSQTKPNKYH